MNEEYVTSTKSGVLLVGKPLTFPPPPKSTIIIGGNPGWHIGVDKKFNWFQKKMIKWCFGFEVVEHKDENAKKN